jgi:quercetin dioxygenase-like cupin family protein
MKKQFLLLIAIAGILAGGTVRSQAQYAAGGRETPLATIAAQPSNAPGMTLTTVIAEYKPGTLTPPHRHGHAFAMVYILDGTIVSKVNDGPETVLHAGDHFTEEPNAHHVVFRNPSKTRPAKVLAVFLAPTAEAQNDLAILDSK